MKSKHLHAALKVIKTWPLETCSCRIFHPSKLPSLCAEPPVNVCLAWLLPGPVHQHILFPLPKAPFYLFITQKAAYTSCKLQPKCPLFQEATRPLLCHPQSLAHHLYLVSLFIGEEVQES